VERGVTKKKSAIAAVLLLTVVLAALAGCAGSKRAVPRPDDLFGSRAYRHFLSGDMPRAIEAYKKGYVSARGNDHGIGAARYLSNVGRAFYELGQIDSAALYFAKAYQEFKIYGYDAGALRSAAFLAVCFASAGDDASARQWLRAASPATGTGKSRRREDEHYYAVIRGMVDFRLTSKVSDESALNAAAAFYVKKKNHAILSTIYGLMADVELARGNNAAAASHLNTALSSIDRSGEKYKRSAVLLKLAKASFCAGNASAGKHYYERAADCAPKGVTVPPMEEVASCGWVRPG
jgi:tetratricopeptide (TPR) repeat protein